MFKNIDKLLYWISERYSVYLKKTEGQPIPWTTDPIIGTYRFCNVHRENDRVTEWIHDNWLKPNCDEPDLWFAVVVSRLFNLPTTLSGIEFPVPNFNPENLKQDLHHIRLRGINVFNNAYIVSTNGERMNKIDYVTGVILTPLWERRDYYRPQPTDTLQSFFGRLNTAHGMGKFMSGQVVADMKWFLPLRCADDWATFAEPGPGSLRGMRRVLGLDVNDTAQDKHWKKNINDLRLLINSEKSKIEYITIPYIDAQNTQNNLCEFDKFMRALDGGRPKQKYRRFE